MQLKERVVNIEGKLELSERDIEIKSPSKGGQFSDLQLEEDVLIDVKPKGTRMESIAVFNHQTLIQI